jgi:hypothetical protein
MERADWVSARQHKMVGHPVDSVDGHAERSKRYREQPRDRVAAPPKIFFVWVCMLLLHSHTKKNPLSPSGQEKAPLGLDFDHAT